jgi:predicted amidophosphoribosyltransferase
MTIKIHVMGDYWAPECDERTELGELIHRAKDLCDRRAANVLADRFARFVVTVAPDDAAIVPIPASPDRPSQLLEMLAGERAQPVVHRRNVTVRIRDLEPAERSAVVQQGGYEVAGGCEEMDVVLLDDVVLTGTTLCHVGELLLAAGAASVVGVAIARTRRR